MAENPWNFLKNVPSHIFGKALNMPPHTKPYRLQNIENDNVRWPLY